MLACLALPRGSPPELGQLFKVYSRILLLQERASVYIFPLGPS